MKVSVVTVCFNSEKTIEDTLRSIQAQTYSDIEYIVVDGLSKDRTNDIVNKYNDIISVHISEKDNGLYDAMNKGISMASGDVIGILNSDDVLADEFVIQKIVAGFESEKIDAVYSDLIYVSEHNLSKPTRLYSSKVFSKKLIKFGIMLPHPTFYVRKRCYEEFGLYKTNYRVAADFELLARFMSKDITSRRLPFISVKMREGGISSSGLLWRVHQNFEIVRACKENNIYTNIFLVMLKLPYKLLTLLTRWFIPVGK
ncbi:PGL/p-HBAD biosynthesis glycosyltransferase Rv2957/MT3031 [Shewanella putrefaciens]|uniref:glycosyltransferase family 2 protein n=1 Tax=Shewanella putrefaciens TaxID=24 RepID=UPI000DF9367A|nr:glycosyltransferase family 2 protein [Shewanella putrefaciens]SUJ07221.1 PGL/p-HBAD biosynthesis glycosyltransferase Rv2957/MT3031 [Shewanella putrefaciens]